MDGTWQELSPQTGSLLSRIGFEAWRPELPEMASVQDGTWGEAVLADVEGVPTRDGTAIRLPIRGSGLHRLDRERMSLNVPARLGLSDGSELKGRCGHIAERGTSVRVGSGVGQRAVLEIEDWTWTASKGASPVAWVGAMGGASVRRGNVLVRLTCPAQMRSRRDILRLEGHLVWYVTPNKAPDPGCVLIEGDVSDWNALWSDFRAMEFVLGSRLRIDLLVGVDAAGRPVAARGPHLGIRGPAEGPPLMPVPDRLDRPEQWSAALMPLLSTALARAEDRSYVAVAGYVDSLVDHLDGAYLKAQVALEALCRALLGERIETSLVQDTGAWVRWARSRRDEIVALAKDEMSSRKLLGKVENAFQSPATDAVPAALRALGLEVPAEVLAEVKKRNVAAHEFVMTKRDESLEASVTRLRMVQSLLAVVVARSVGYEGPICGWKYDDDTWERPPLDWWPEQLDARATSRFRYEEQRDRLPA